MTEAQSGISANTTAIGGLNTSVTQQGNTITSQGQSITQITASVWAAQKTADTAQSTANGAVQSVNAVTATVTQQGNAITAQGTQISQLTATVNGVSTEISDISGVVNATDAQLSAYRTLRIKVDANGRQYVAGMTQNIEDTDQGIQSNTIFLQDRFSIMNAAAGKPQLIFTTQGNQVIIDSAVIGSAAITRAKLSDSLQSDNYISGQRGLYLNFSTGQIENNGETAGEGRMMQSNNKIEVFDENNVRLVLIGKY
ncbi:phage tail tip fiber protein [Candidatus Symbiopectobacterium endolongispinus]|nr:MULTISPECIES: DUF1983 domain-containing protein [Symbiopectobacterium]